MAHAKFDFTSEVVVISGAGRGIGRTMTSQFSKANATVIAIDRDSEGLEQTKQLVPQCHIRSVDIRNRDEVHQLMRYIKDTFGRLDVCINNAAIAPHAALETCPELVWERVYDVNCKGTFLMTRESSNVMKDLNTAGAIINFSSAAAMRGSAGSAAYASSRAAVESFGRVVAIELSPYRIRVNTIRPGLIDTQVKPLPQSMKESLEKRIPTLPMQRPGEPEEVGNVAMFLASDLASYMTGSVVTVDGGSLCGTYPSQHVTDDDVRYRWVYE